MTQTLDRWRVIGPGTYTAPIIGQKATPVIRTRNDSEDRTEAEGEATQTNPA